MATPYSMGGVEYGAPIGLTLAGRISHVIKVITIATVFQSFL